MSWLIGRWRSKQKYVLADRGTLIGAGDLHAGLCRGLGWSAGSRPILSIVAEMELDRLLRGAWLGEEQGDLGKFGSGQLLLCRVAEVHIVLMARLGDDLDMLVGVANRDDLAAMLGGVFVMPRMPGVRRDWCQHRGRGQDQEGEGTFCLPHKLTRGAAHRC